LADSGEDEDDESLPGMLRVFERGPIPRKPRGLLLRLERHRLVLLDGAPEAAAVIYGFGQPDLDPVLLASILRTWRETVGAELAVFTRDTLSLVLPQPIENEAEVRRCALEIYAVDSDLDGAPQVLTMAALRHWSFWWD
jgi:hypothetical protein